MINSNIVNSIGLVLDIVGALVLWRYGLPAEIIRTGDDSITAEQTNKNEVAKAKRYDCFAHCGVALIVLGFALQLVSNFIGDNSTEPKAAANPVQTPGLP